MKDLEISKELLSEVLKLEVVKHSLFNKSNNSFNITYMQSEDSLKSSWMPINIYEFAFKCKEWALSKGYILSSNNYDNGGCCQILQENVGECSECGESIAFKIIHSFTEIEAIIKACEWLQENIKEIK